MKRALVLLLVGACILITGCLTLEDATREGSALMTRRVNERIPLGAGKLTAEQTRAFGEAFFDQAQEDYQTLEDWLKELGDKE